MPVAPLRPIPVEAVPVMDNPGVRVWWAQTAATDDAAAVADGDAARGGQIPAIRQGSPATTEPPRDDS